MPEDKVEKVITLKIKENFVVVGTRVEKNRGIDENWEYFSRKINGVYISEDRFKVLKAGCKSYSDSSPEVKAGLKYKRELEELLKTERNQHYEGNTGYFVMLVHKHGSYDLRAWKVEGEIREVKEAGLDKKVSLDETPDFEEIVTGVVNDSKQLVKSSPGDNYKPSATSDTNKLPKSESSSKPKSNVLGKYKPNVAQRTPTSKHEDNRGKPKLASQYQTLDGSAAADVVLKKSLKKG